jgi:hypothetical protein
LSSSSSFKYHNIYILNLTLLSITSNFATFNNSKLPINKVHHAPETASNNSDAGGDRFNINLIDSNSLLQHVQIYENIVKPKVDSKQYRGIRLANGLRILLISNPETSHANVALDVNVGSMSDPVHLQGLAHFLEHMLFLGSKKVRNMFFLFINNQNKI